VSVCNTLRDAQIDGDTGTLARVLYGTDILSIGFDNDALFSVFS
jgi:hypothetical protein